ncbi:DUF5723 family protein [Tamlana sp. 2201CG12-4]|uniref:DUF5723 family protein n=1 Tax=Tamlana sp. 2201CG12-4 TaxID=3112582 RepID=UPI002DB9FFBE|nr:DUF5723 family protein [Tamlana sp. 2201CG12-4]MEC3906902.1 DUF5723 family protein [Tamlana sp. 2201CG12-4]
MKRKISTLVILVFWGVALSQNKQILYGFSEIPQSLLLNPGGKIKNKGYFGIPLLSHVHFDAGITGTTLYNIFADNNTDFNTKLRHAVYGMNSNDLISFNQQLEIFSAGFAFGKRYEKNEYLSFGLYEELDIINYFPKDYAVLALEGNRNNINRVFDASDINTSAEVISVFHVGYNKKVNDRFTYGVRGKIYSSIINVNSTKNKGRFVTVRGNDNIYDHIFDLDLELRTSGIASFINDENSEFSNDIKALRKRVLFGGNLGLGFDVGFTYHMTDQWTFDASLLDIGFISHTKDIENYAVQGKYTFEGINPIFTESGSGQTADEYWSEIEEDFEDLFTVDTTTTKFTTWRPVKLNASLNYAFGKKLEEDCNCVQNDEGYLNAVGLQLFGINRPKLPQLALTAYYYRRLFKGLRIKGTYTIDSYSFNNVGLGISAHIGRVNFYFMADNFLDYKNIYNADGVSLQLGFNYIFNKNED